MRPIPTLFVLAFAAVFAAAPGRAAADPRVEIVDYGTYKTGTRTTVPMPISVSGKMNLVAGARLIERTREVMGQIGNAFGFRYRIRGLPPGAKITIRTRHPMLTNPETGRRMDYGQREQEAAGAGERYTGFSFDYSWEIAEGDWSFEIIYQGRVLATQKFRVVVPIN